MGTISFTLDLTASLAGTLRVCMSSNGGVYVTVPSLSDYTISARLVFCVCTNAESYTLPLMDDMGVDMQKRYAHAQHSACSSRTHSASCTPNLYTSAHAFRRHHIALATSN